MRGLVDKSQADTHQTAHSSASPARGKADSALPQLSNRPEAVIQRKLQDRANLSHDLSSLGALQERANHSPQTLQLAKLQGLADNAAARQNQPTASAVEGPPAALPAAALMVSPSLLVGRADDPAERQADAMADAALASLAGAGQPHSGVVSRSAAAGDQLGGLAVAAPVQREIDTARGGGSALGQREVSMFSGAYGVDLSPVRVHTDSRADGLSRSLQAHAFTTGSDVFFRNGTYKPGTESGDRLIGHELAHVATEGGAARRSMAPIRRWSFFSPSTWFSDEKSKEQAAEATGTLIPTTGGTIDLAKDAPTGIDKAGLVAGDVGKNLGIAGGAFGLAGGAFQAGLGISGGIDDYNRYNQASAHAIDKGLAWRSGKDNAKATVEGMGSIAMGGLAIGEAAGHAAAHGAQAVPGLGIAVSGLTFGQGLWRTAQHIRTRATLSNLENLLESNKAKNRWLPVVHRKYGNKMGANMTKTIVGGLGIAVGGIALAGLMATPVGWGLAGAALGAAAIYGGYKIYQMYKENKQKNEFETTRANTRDGKAAIDAVRLAVKTAQEELDNDKGQLKTLKDNKTIADTKISQLDGDETNTNSIKHKTSQLATSDTRVGELLGLKTAAISANGKAQEAYADLSAAISIENTSLEEATAKLKAAVDAATEAKQKFAKFKQANKTTLKSTLRYVSPNTLSRTKNIIGNGFKDRDQKLVADQNNIETRKQKLEEMNRALNQADIARHATYQSLTVSTSNYDNEILNNDQHKNDLQALELERTTTDSHRNTLKQQIEALEGANGSGGSINTHQTVLTNNIIAGESSILTGEAPESPIVAYEMAWAVTDYAGQLATNAAQIGRVLIALPPNKRQQNIEKEGKDALSIAQAINITDDQITPSNPAPTGPDPLLIELIETKLSLSKSM
jgi:hypothetical protein